MSQLEIQLEKSQFNELSFFIFKYTRVNSFDFIELGMIQKIKKMDWTWFAVNLRIKWDLSHLNVVHAFLFSANLNFDNFSEGPWF